MTNWRNFGKSFSKYPIYNTRLSKITKHPKLIQCIYVLNVKTEENNIFCINNVFTPWMEPGKRPGTCSNYNLLYLNACVRTFVCIPSAAIICNQIMALRKCLLHFTHLKYNWNRICFCSWILELDVVFHWCKLSVAIWSHTPRFSCTLYDVFSFTTAL